MNSNQNENARTTEDTRRKMRNAAETISGTWIRQRRFNDRRQSKIEDSYMEQNDFETESARTTEDTRRKTNTAANNLSAFFNNKTKMQRQ